MKQLIVKLEDKKMIDFKLACISQDKKIREVIINAIDDFLWKYEQGGK